MRFLLTIGIIALLLTTTAFASHVFLEGIRIDQELAAGEQTLVRVELDTQGDTDIRVRASIPELGVYRGIGPFSIEGLRGESTEVSRTILLPTDELEPGEYWVRISVKTDSRKIVKHRPIVIY